MNNIILPRRRLTTSASVVASAIKTAERLRYVSGRPNPTIAAVMKRNRVVNPYWQIYFTRSISLAAKTIESGRFVPKTEVTGENNSPTVPTIANAKQDEEGNDMLVYITPRAAARLNAIRESEKNPRLFLRVTVESGGCHGFQYLMGLKESLDPKEDT
ncbi:hypothetical protein V1509DRAFT_631877 [Lipomyces kononenkoae]